ncbi:hypothetical protein NARC_60202 [Candidatus Nitrosocosmicus arcticus]|uniref:Uncharacterized protein n=1 Tax=Candidatus Nitrosocosmicus arcticus TaxID=2035267 RepID=A0A557SW42_9ARCH|nr:hypothetical protein NARC_60202 [Candidatus Nitrosocosmicus arcticus]
MLPMKGEKLFIKSVFKCVLIYYRFEIIFSLLLPRKKSPNRHKYLIKM